MARLSHHLFKGEAKSIGLVLNMSKNEITENTTLEEILKHPESIPVLMRLGLPCPTCPMVRLEMGRLKIGDAARMYGINVDNLLAELNRAISKR